MKRGIGSHHATEGEFDTWLTPRAIVEALGPFDLDPCAAPSPRPWPTAKRHIELPEDGLAADWEGRVFLNPPYGAVIKAWMQKMSEHRNGIAITFARTETDFWQRYVFPFASGILFIRGRINFRFPDGTDPNKNAGGPSALIAYSTADARILKGSGIAGYFVSGQVMVP
jgi:hypothetical protein